MASNKCLDPRREGKPHNWVVDGVKQTSRIGTAGDNVCDPPLYRWCNFCKAEDRETPLCEAEVRDPGRWPSWHTCGRTAATTSTLDRRDREDGNVHNYCKTHHPEAVTKRRAEADKQSERKYQAEMRRMRIGWYGGDTIKLLQEFGEWAAANADLLEADEWLGSIAARLSAHTRKLDTGRD